MCTVIDYASEYTFKGGKLSGTLITDNTPKFSTVTTTNTNGPSKVNNVHVNYESLARDIFLE